MPQLMTSHANSTGHWTRATGMSIVDLSSMERNWRSKSTQKQDPTNENRTANRNQKWPKLNLQGFQIPSDVMEHPTSWMFHDAEGKEANTCTAHYEMLLIYSLFHSKCIAIGKSWMCWFRERKRVRLRAKKDLQCRKIAMHESEIWNQGRRTMFRTNGSCMTAESRVRRLKNKNW